MFSRRSLRNVVQSTWKGPAFMSAPGLLPELPTRKSRRLLLSPHPNMIPATAARVSIPGDFSAFERSLVDKTEVALTEGLELERWTRDPNRKIEKHKLNLNRRYELQNEAFGYLADVTIAGRTLPALGALQHVEFGSVPGPNPEQRLKDFVLRHFLNTSHWV